MTEDNLPKPLSADGSRSAPPDGPDTERFADTLPPPPPVARTTRPAPDAVPPAPSVRPAPRTVSNAAVSDARDTARVVPVNRPPVDSLAPREQLETLNAMAGTLVGIGGLGRTPASLVPDPADADTLVFPVPQELLMDLSAGSDEPLPKPLAPTSGAPKTTRASVPDGRVTAPAPDADSKTTWTPASDGVSAAPQQATVQRTSEQRTAVQRTSLGAHPRRVSSGAVAGGISRAPARFPLKPLEPQTVSQRYNSNPARQRRRKPDLIWLAPRALAILAWFSLGAAGTFFDRAHPVGYGLDGFFGVRRSLTVVSSDLVIARALLMVTALLCVTGLGLNSLRMRRAGDRYNRSLIFLGIVSLALLIAESSLL